MISPNIHDWVVSEENNYQTNKIKIADNWEWNMREHVQLIFHLKNGMFYTGQNDFLRQFRALMEPMLELAYWTEDIDVKDVTFFIENERGKILSFLVKKYHDEIYVRENDLDTLFDEITESDIDYGGVLVQDGVKRPEVMPLNSIAFCDQTDILGGPIAFKVNFSPEKLKSMAQNGWGEEKNGADITLEELSVLATNKKDSTTQGSLENDLPGKNIEVYIVIGSMPNHYLKGDNDMEGYTDQVQVVALYTNKDSKKVGVTLYRKAKTDEMLKFFTSKKVYQRGLGRGFGEKLIGPQVWMNFVTIHKTNLLEAGSKHTLYTDDPNYTNKNKIQEMENLEITTIDENKRIFVTPSIAPTNIQLFTNEQADLEQNAQLVASAFDPIMGKEASSGTTFRGQERSVAQGRGQHDKNRGKRAKFIEEIYRDFIIPRIKKEILKDRKFLATLSNEEMTWVAERVSTIKANQKIKDMMLKTGRPVSLEQQKIITDTFKNEFIKSGNKQLIEILKDEFKDIEIKMGINVAGKQKDLVNLSDKLLSIFQFIFANPQAFQQAMTIPGLAKAFENILEYGGLSIGEFSTLITSPVVSEAPQEAPQETKLLEQAIPQA